MQRTRIERIKKTVKSGWFLIFIPVGITLLFLVPAVIRLNKDTAQVHKDPTEENKREFDVSLERVKAITSGIGTLATIAGGIVLYLNFRVANRNAAIANKNSRIANRNVEIANAKQVTERFSKAIDQLGNEDQIQVRLGGVYSLERIAKDSPEDCWTIVEVLSSFIREYAAKRKDERFSLEVKATDNQTLKKQEPIRLPTDIQTAFTVMDRIYKERTSDRRIDLQGIDFSNTDLVGVNFTGANLIDAKFCGADLNVAQFNRALLIKADFRAANVEIAFFKDADLTGADFRSAIMDGAQLQGADLEGAQLQGAQLQGADLENAKCLTKEQLSQSKLYKTKLPAGIDINPNHNCEDLGITP
ncbi:pentapeptide repeat-containing protein [Leptolyngbya sp. ST-U4]|uniref:pentapeptide repeat-containing protein n=1 Tax=Leptolyngbya sp. ST-U4 TaxID=2933912 RepID=UPI003296AAC1